MKIDLIQWRNKIQTVAEVNIRASKSRPLIGSSSWWITRCSFISCQQWGPFEVTFSGRCFPGQWRDILSSFLSEFRLHQPTGEVSSLCSKMSLSREYAIAQLKGYNAEVATHCPLLIIVEQGFTFGTEEAALWRFMINFCEIKTKRELFTKMQLSRRYVLVFLWLFRFCFNWDLQIFLFS